MRQQVLSVFKALHRARQQVFKDDTKALDGKWDALRLSYDHWSTYVLAARRKINDEFIKNKDTKDPNEVEKLLKFAREVELELKSSVIQAQEKEPGVYALKITSDTKKLDNKPYDPNVEIPKRRRASKDRPCCGDNPKR